MKLSSFSVEKVKPSPKPYKLADGNGRTLCFPCPRDTPTYGGRPSSRRPSSFYERAGTRLSRNSHQLIISRVCQIANSLHATARSVHAEIMYLNAEIKTWETHAAIFQ